MYKIDIKDEYEQYNIEDILKRYKKYLDKETSIFQNRFVLYSLVQ